VTSPSLRLLYESIVEQALTSDLTMGDGDSIENDLFLTPETNNLLLAVTEEQWTRLFSAALNGAYETYPQDYNEVLYPLIKAAKVTFCEAMIECLTNNEAVRNLVGQIAVDAVNAETDITEANTHSGARMLGGNGCDLDTVWGQMGKLVDYMNQVNLDFFENLNLLSTASDRVEAWLDIIPVLGDFAEAVVNGVTETGAALLSSYEASYNDSLRDEIVCDLFCLAIEQDGCTLTIQQVLEYLLERYNLNSGSLGALSALQMITTFNRLIAVIAQGGGLAYSGDDMVYISFIVQLAAVSIGEKFFQISSTGAYYNEMHDSVPSVGWETECFDCTLPTWSHTWDFSEGLGDWSIIQGVKNTYIDPEDVHSSGANQSTRSIAVIITIPEDTTVTGAIMEYSYTLGGFAGAAGGSVAKAFHDGSSYRHRQNFNAAVNTDGLENWVWEGEIVNPPSWQFIVRSSLYPYATSTWSGSCQVRSITLNGIGTNPFESS